MNIIYENKKDPIYFGIQKKLSLRPHIHKEIEIVYVVKGSAKAYADVLYAEINTGDIFISFPNQVHYYENSEIGEYYVLCLSPKLFFGMKDTFYSTLPKHNSFKAKTATVEILKSAKKSSDSQDITRAAGFLNLIIADIFDTLELKPNLRQNSGTVREVLEYCENHFTEDISLASVAAGTHLSRCYISHLFNSKLSMGFSDYINILRVNAACELLNETDKKISDISGDVGYGTIRSFNRAFAKILGETPQSYRSGIKNGI